MRKWHYESVPPNLLPSNENGKSTHQTGKTRTTTMSYSAKWIKITGAFPSD